VLSEAIDRLEKELKALEREYRQELPKEIQRARALGDLRENAEYKSAIERQQFIQARIGHVQKQLKELSLVSESALPKDKVALGSVVTLHDAEGREITYELVIPDMADFSKGMVSVTSPIGRALAGRKIGDAVSVTIPAGTRAYEITGLKTIHDKDA
jgi:transcription elongation factor GreA